jgi:hypothetical protein
MMPLYDVMMQAQQGEAAKAMARQFGLSETQVSDAFAALAPAFSAGLKRNVQGPQHLGDFLAALSGGRHARYFEDMTAAFTPQGMTEGNGILGHLFGSKDLSRQVAAQAAQATGIGQEVIKQMLPVLAATIMGGLFKQSTGQMNAASNPSSGNPLVDMMQQFMRMQTGYGTPPPQPAKEATNPFAEMMQAMFGQAPSSPQRRDTSDAPAPSDNPLGRIFEDMMAAGMAPFNQGAPGTARKPDPEPDHRATPERANPYDALFGQMFESGREIQQGYCTARRHR